MPEVRIHDRVSASTQLAWKVLFGEELLRAADEEMLSSLQENPESWGRLLLDAWTTFAAIGGPGRPREQANQGSEEAPGRATTTPRAVPAAGTGSGADADATKEAAVAPVASPAPAARPEPDPGAVRAPAATVDFFDPDEEEGPGPERRKASVEEVKARLVELVAEVSGYPPEVFEDHLDLEVDLGIDSIKQVETLGRVREEYGLPMDEDFVMRDYATIGKMADYIVGRLATET
ncbi:phosphopantetheine-binding protein [Streptomyces avidinii]|uniref:acyl carrier protein n=1 Tax=Streptomyces avidinii TaxID=1895 RepID=UPI00386BC69A|nr:phosphopantetheine-binding protein [Streptomyces avidinii]